MQDEAISGCCSNPARVNAPVDCYFTETGIRLRHLPANICLSCRDFYIPSLVANDDLVESILNCINNKPTDLLIIKSRSRIPAETESWAEEGFQPAFLDIGVGENSGLVVEKVKGYWNENSCTGIVINEGIEVRDRLAQLDLTTECNLFPSLVYDTPSHPRSVQVELTTRCNLSCSYCTQSELKIKEDVPVERLIAVLDQVDFSQVDNVDFTGLGEPMLHPDLPLVIHEIRKRGQPSSIRVVTNGTVLTPERIKAVCSAGITSIAFSIDSVDPARFAKSRGGAKLEKVLNNLELLVAYRRQHDLALTIKIKAVLIDNPYEEAEGLLELSARLGLEMPHFSCLDNRSIAKDQYKDDWLEDNWSANGSAEFTKWAEQRWSQLTAHSTGLKQHISPVNSHYEFINPVLTPPGLCRWAIDAVFISASGDMLPCCEQMIDIPRTYHGSILKKELAHLWQDELLWGYRLPLSVGVVPSGCVGCTWAPAHSSYAGSMNLSNQEVSVNKLHS